VVDLRTGLPLAISAELLPARQAALQAKGNKRLQRRTENFVNDWNRSNEGFPAKNAGGLRA